MNKRHPEYRRLRVYAIDPSLSARHETVDLNELTLTVPWECNPVNERGWPKPDGAGDAAMLGPVGNYLEVVDVDPATGCCYAPVDLNEDYILAGDGLSPSELNPQFHQQMVYAVAMKTIEHFERALGRPAMWALGNGKERHAFVPRLRIYPHALREANAYYDPGRKAILFGYFPAPAEGSRYMVPGTTVFTCLSHDVIAHEVTHALLDGLHQRFAEPTNVDVLALHEGFADIVAIFQHFANPDVLKDQIRKTRGDLEQQNMLGQLAQQFGQATERGRALRDAIGYEDDEGGWHRYEPNPAFLAEATESHDRGAILVAAVFDAFLRMYKSRIVDLLRIATQGSGILPLGELNPDLVNRLASEAAKTSGHVLQMCIRALDYCPPVDVTFGDYLRAIITADKDLFPDDEYNYRTALMESFSLFGIRPARVRNISLESLMLPQGTANGVKLDIGPPRGLVQDYDTDTRETTWRNMRINASRIHAQLAAHPQRDALFEELGLAAGPVKKTVGLDRAGRPSFEVHAVRTALRRGSRTNLVPDLVIEITQRRDGFFDPEDQRKADAGAPGFRNRDGDFIFRRGCTLVVHPKSGDIRWIARTDGNIADDTELNRVREYILGSDTALVDAFRAPVGPSRIKNPFAALHRG